jgi:predicted nucleotidyltransferase
MLPLIETHRLEIAKLCRQYGVRALDVFGSAARETDFDPECSDVDLLVTYEQDRPAPNLAEYFGLTEQLAALLGRKVDLVMSGAVRNPYIRADIDRWKQPVYAA